MYFWWLKDRQWWYLISATAILLGFLVLTPQLLHMEDSRYRGIPVHLNADEHLYLPRVQETLLQSGKGLGNAVTGGVPRPAVQGGLLEQTYGFLFGWTGINAGTLMTLFDFLIPILFFFVLIYFFSTLGFTPLQSYTGAILFSLLELYNLGRPLHQRESFLLTLLAITLIINGLEYSFWCGIIGGVLLGLLVGVYFWSYTSGWAFFLVLLIVEVAILSQYLWRERNLKGQLSPLFRMSLFLKPRRGTAAQESRDKLLAIQNVQRLVVIGIVAGLMIIPMLLSMIRAAAHENFPDVYARSGIGYSHMPESWAWSLLFLIMAGGITAAWFQNREHRSFYAVLYVWTAFLIINQQVLHGIRFIFVSHYLFFHVLAAVVVLLYTFRNWTLVRAFSFFAAALFLSGIALDNTAVLAQWRRDTEDFEEQHLATALSALQKLPKQTILSDPLTSSFIASYTHHDVLFTHYLHHELLSHQQVAERYCLTQLPIEPEQRTPEKEAVLIFAGAYDAQFDEESKSALREQELSLASAICKVVDGDSARYLTNYGVTYFLWDKKRHPEWDLQRIALPLDLKQNTRDWSLWEVVY